MQTSAIIIQGALLVLLVLGLLMAVVPGNLNRWEKGVYRVFRLISDESANRPLSERGVLRNRVIGVVYVAIAFVILLNLHLQIGKLADKPVPVWTDSALVAQTDGSLHESIVHIVRPAIDQRVGVVVATIADDARDISAFGRVHLDSEQPPDGDTLFEIGSISKVFTGVLLADSIEEKKLSLDTPMVSLLPPISVHPDSLTNRITLKHLVTHTAGLPRTPDNLFDPVQLWRVITAGDSYRDYTDATLLNIVSQKAPSRPPGEQYAYSNVGFGVLGFIVSRQSGLDYDQMVKTVIDQPLSLRATGVNLDQAQRARLATGYRSYFHIGPFYLTQVAAPWEFPNIMAGAGGLHSTANDMLVFLAANMGRQPSTLTQALEESQKVLYAQEQVQIGMGWMHDGLKSGKPIIWHNGATGGYAGYIGFTDDRRFGVVVLSNSAKTVDDLGREILEQLCSKD